MELISTSRLGDVEELAELHRQLRQLLMEATTRVEYGTNINGRINFKTEDGKNTTRLWIGEDEALSAAIRDWLRKRMDVIEAQLADLGFKIDE